MIFIQLFISYVDDDDDNDDVDDDDGLGVQQMKLETGLPILP